MLRRLAVLAPIVLLFACKQSGSKPPALSPEVAVSAVVVNGGTSPDQPVEDDAHEIAIGFGGSGYLVVWTQPSGVTSDDVYGARMSASGELVGSPFPISTAVGDQGAPGLAFDGQNWLVVFEDHRAGQYMNVYGARVSSDGTVLDPGGIPIATQVDHQVRPAVAFDGANFLVVWSDHRSGTSWDVYASRVARDGTVLDGDGFVVSAAGGHQINPAVAFDGTNYLVAWQDLRSGNYDIYAARVSTAGVVIDQAGIPVSTAPYDQTVPAATFDGQEFVVAWQDLRGGVAPDIQAARVGSDGAVLDRSGIAMSTATGGQTAPALAFDGVYTLVLWIDAATLPASVRGARLDSTGTLLDAAGFSVADGASGRSVAVASDAAGRALSAHAAVDPLGGEARLRTRAITDWAVLAVAKDGKGVGAVTSSPEGIDCGAACSSRFDAPTQVLLVATPDGDSVFGGWSGACAGSGDCSVTIDGAKSVTATFLPLYRLTVALGSSVSGTITSDPAGIDCGAACSSRFVEGTRVRLTAKGIPGASVFSTWGGDCASIATGDAALAECVLDAPKSVTATFLPAFTVTLSSTGTGQGALTLGGTTCPSGNVCGADVVAGTTATVTAAPSAGSVLKSWSGCTAVAGAPSTCTVSATARRYVSARFEPSTIPLTATTTGTGAGTISGGGLACSTGSATGCAVAVENPATVTTYTAVTLTATPSALSVFKSWNGCIAVPGAPDTCTVAMSSAKAVSAKFEPSTMPLTAATTGVGAGAITGGGLACTTGSTDGCTAAVENPANVPTYTTVTLAAAGSVGSVFKSWYGCFAVPGAPDTCTLTVNFAKSISAKFEPSTFPLVVRTSGTGAGTVTGAGLACTTGSDAGCTAAVENPANTPTYTTVTLAAAGSPGSVFKSWSGCIADPSAPGTCTLLVNRAGSVTARFEPSTYPLSVTTSGAGAGTVTGGGIACTTGASDGCTAAIDNPVNGATYTTVTLKATPSAGSVFKSWFGCAGVPGASDTCTIWVNMAKFVTARFEPSTFPLTVATSGTAAGTVTGGGVSCTTGSSDGCTAPIDNPPNVPTYTTVMLTATPAAGASFKSWSGCAAVAGAPNTCTVLVNTAKSVTAKFEPATFPLTATAIGSGAGTVTGAGLACTTGSSAGCTADVENPTNDVGYTTVTLTATPSAGSVFKGWFGCATVTGAPEQCTITVTMAKSITAKFEPSTIPLTVMSSGLGAGTVTGSGIACATGSTDGCTAFIDNPPDTPSYTTVTLTAVPDAASLFNGWMGCTPLVDAPQSCTIVVNIARTVTAKYVLR